MDVVIVGLILIVASLMLMTAVAVRPLDRLRRSGYRRSHAITWMPYYPVWTLTYVLIALLVFYALAQHGGRNV